ncbi:MAG: hypothetical protein AseanaTS_18270 [Candidatus Pelagadaptatus aseana]|uniref:hypothetical protein n=1 Tax=Candidatus Pelagadaptatus aseana TaxID=3120508 RepID=UPI0039B32EA0
MTTPANLQDSKELLSKDGFAISNTWYHGTSSGLLASIQQDGLKRSGDKAMKQAAKQTMATIGNSYSESFEPVFLTQSKELAYYWAELAVRNRKVRFEADEEPAVLAITLPEELNNQVRPDVGAAGLLMVKEGEAYLAYVASLFEKAGLEAPSIDLMKADRMDYLNQLGMAYYDKDIAADYVSVV